MWTITETNISRHPSGVVMAGFFIMTNKDMIFIYREKNGLSVYDMIPAYVRRHKEETCPQCAYYKRCRRSSFDIGGACREGLAENG